MPATTIENLDGTRTELFDVATREDALVALVRETFEQHWAEVLFGPCIQGAVFEGRFQARPRVTLLDGYVTVEAAGDPPWHFHLCVGHNAGTPALPTPPELAAWRRCGRAAFFQDRDPDGHPSAWGIRMWNGRGEQMLTVFFPNPWIDPERRCYVERPDWSRLESWMAMRARHAGVPPEPPPPDARRPRTH